MVKLFEKKKTKEDIEREYADAIAEFQKLIKPLPGVLNDGDEPEAVDISLDSSDLNTSLLNNAAKFTENELSAILRKIEEKVARDPEAKPLMTRALNSLTKAVNSASPENLKELMWTALAVSRKGDAYFGVSTSMAGVGLSLFITSLIVGATVAAAAASFPITLSVACGLLVTGAVIFSLGIDHILLSENSKIAKEIKGIRATLSRV